MNASSSGISRRTCLGMMMSTLLGCRSSTSLQAESQPEIAITIDDFDVNATTPLLDADARNVQILDTLRAMRVQAAAFVCGRRVDNPDGKRRLMQWNDAGHLLANHTYSHWRYPDIGFEKFSADVLRADAVLAEYPMFRKWFRFPYLKEGITAEQRDQMRAFLKAHGYRMGHVTVDASDWAIDARLRQRLAEDPHAALDPYREFYLEHLWDRTLFYDRLAKEVLHRPVKHTLLIHHNLATALFLPHLLQMYVERGWRIIDAGAAFQDPIFTAEPDILPAGESILWALARQSGRFADRLRYPAEDEVYERRRMDELRL